MITLPDTKGRARLEKNRVVAMFFPGITGKESDYVGNMLDILEKNQDWIDGNAGKKAEQYEQMQEVLRMNCLQIIDSREEL